jgi:hypothetical protein
VASWDGGVKGRVIIKTEPFADVTANAIVSERMSASLGCSPG